MNLSQSRLAIAGIPLTIQADHAPLSAIVPSYALFANRASRLANFGDIEDRIAHLIQASGGPVGVGATLASTLRIPHHVNTATLLKRAIELDSSNAAMGRVLRLEELRANFVHLSQQNDSGDCFEGCFGLLGIGVSLAEAQQLFSAYKSASDDDNQFALITAIVGGGQLTSLLDIGILDDDIDDSELLTALVKVYEEQKLEPLLDYMQESHSWYKRICLYYLAGYFSGQSNRNFAKLEVLEALLELFSSDDDSDAFTMGMYAIGQVVKQVGVEAAVRVLEVARDDHGNGSQKQSLLINASYRAQLNEAELSAVTEIISHFDVDDNDCKRALGRALDIFNKGLPTAAHWFFRGGYGRGVDFYDPFAPEPGDFVPALIRSLLFTPERECLSIWIKTLKAMSIPSELVSLISSHLITLFPEMASIFAQLLKDSNDSNQKGLAAALLTCSEEHNSSPIYLRCLLGEEGSGGPVIESPETIGELLSYSTNYSTAAPAKRLLESLSPQGRAICAGFLKAQYIQSQDADHAKLLFKLGHTLVTPIQVNLPIDLRLALGQVVDTRELISFIDEQTETDALRYWSILLEQFTDPDRQSALTLARQEDVWLKSPLALVHAKILKLGQGGWTEREISCVLLSSLGERALQGDLGAQMQTHIERLVNDSDSDVTREARKAAERLGVKAVIVNADSIREGILHPSGETPEQERAEWIERLYTLLNDENDRDDILSLCRTRELWPCLDQFTLGEKWISLAQKGWIAREAMCVLAANHSELLMGAHAEQIRDRVIELCDDGDSDVAREAKSTKSALGL